MKEERQPCPYCSEPILPDAKKCRFCGERLDQKETPSFRPVFMTWITSMALFLLSLFFIRRAPDTSGEFWLAVLGVLVLGGGIAYLVLILRILQSLRNRNARWYGLATFVAFFAFFGLLFNLDTVEAQLGFSPPTVSEIEQPKVVMPSASPFATSLPTPKPSITTVKPAAHETNNKNDVECIGPDGKVFSTTMDECKTLNEKWSKPVDYMTNCKIHSDCGGGTVYMAKSECDKPCSGRKPVQTSAPSQYNSAPVSGSNYFCVNNVTGYTYYTSSGDQCNKDNYKATCLDLAKKVYYDPCMDKCLRDANDAGSYCIYNLADSAKTACLDQKNKDHQSCMDACGVKYETEYKKCY